MLYIYKTGVIIKIFGFGSGSGSWSGTGSASTAKL